ncbi:exopolysaccharide biosynthesis protein [Chelativorans sp. M5D2P16]|uniref:exopolysaccharide biosynthesis protein n=1 Tax=Chelativorans sp. M5D2P16 TaxID=3095678 RepID=UPI002ACA0454|nr:exopolysaccharide biosynthesis protein [Chelativorans sp. M5D2P16]MDZ5697546.1 exopolysaccharide biosynthesis protein [Chelativorans sp. M5D2P16]
MTDRSAPDNLEKVLDKAAAAGDGTENVSVSQIMSAVGRRSFGPIMLVISLIAWTPLGGVPGVPTALALTLILVAGQLVVGMEHFWLPRFVLDRSMNRERFRKVIGYIKPVARVIDRVLRERLQWIFQPIFVRFAALICIAVALTVPPLEVVPFAGVVPWTAIAIFALALIARDGFLALIAFAVALGAGYAVFRVLL